MKQRSSSRVLASNGQSCSNTPLGRSVSINSSALSRRPVILNSSCSNFFSPFNIPLKRIKPEPWQRLFEGKKQQQQQPSTRKISSNLDAVINEDMINDHSDFDENSQTSFLPAPIQTHIDHLYEQTDDLILQLSEERFRHKQTRAKIEGELSDRFKEQERKLQELLEQTLLKHENQLNEQERKLTSLFNEQRQQGLQREKQLREELDFVKKSFHLYKVNLDKNHAEQFQVKINEALVATREKLPEKDEQEINRRINDALTKERKLSNEKQKIEIEDLRKHYQNEISIMQKSLTDTAVDQEHVESLKKELLFSKLELNETKERAMNLSTRLQDLENQHIKTIRELNDYRTRFDEQTNEIEKLRTEHVH